MLSRLAVRAATRGAVARRWMASSSGASFELPESKTHLCDGPASKTEANKDELVGYLTDMLRIRRVEVASDIEYKGRAIRGFCHLYDGQEAVAVGMAAGLDDKDDIITTYRCHGVAMARGVTPLEVFAEMFGYREGNVGGKGGSMHLYSADTHFWGGAAIVGAQVPVGAGLGWSHKLSAQGGKPKNVAVTMMGDGAVNQGQVWEAANMASLWKLPVIFLVENNKYGMGTSANRSSMNIEYYKHGNTIPGVQCNGMDVLAVRECMSWAREYVRESGPLFVEMDTYRYHGHSMSDPGISYRDREEVQKVRSTRDCIELVKERLVKNEMMTAAEIKELEKSVRKDVTEELKKAKAGSEPDAKELYTHIYWKETPEFIRAVELGESIVTK